MSKQQGFSFDAPPPMPAHCVTGGASPLIPRDPNVDPADIPRLSGQLATLLSMLQAKREVTNVEMMAAGVTRYTNRISDLRLPKNGGHVINCVRRDGGTSWYSLEEPSQP